MGMGTRKGEAEPRAGNADTWSLFLGQGQIQPLLPPSFLAGGSRGGKGQAQGQGSSGPPLTALQHLKAPMRSGSLPTHPLPGSYGAVPVPAVTFTPRLQPGCRL